MDIKGTINEVSNIIKDINAWLKKQKGDSRALITELKDNLTYLEMVNKHGVDIDEILKDLKIDVYNRLQNEGFSFNTIKNKKIPKLKNIEGSDLASWKGKTTDDLVVSIYDKIRNLKASYPKLKNRPNIRWNVRVTNISKRIILLLHHVRSS